MFVILKSLRSAKNVSVEEMANLIGLKTKAAYYKKEAGSIKFTLEEAKKISDYFGATLEEVFFNNQVSKIETKDIKGVNL